MDNLDVPSVEKKNTEAYQALLEIDKGERTFKSKEGYAGAYALSLFLPPLGIYFFIKYVFFGNGSEDIKAGYISLILTILSALISVWSIGMLFKQTTSTLPNQRSDMIKELITPENQNKLKELFR
ncbi:hypothetical protein COT62_01615 [Candidatus Roizmanbacteria bacterium CG09_land_8_20_14_0_10_41_9]|uniref:Uncharacterized protein n=1 Tax=Candidatus Roizmanbacteria bacterium CG09_land_8_20_14_0_10_41_9 TaxID=1974850 RepID=A0A2H0WV94_9BACT|nr:MAG: hypothetical protein COT62_01615 [Candidatus Roizmanbacteria bacterium CG09_land_8_20_14_0_10_41_9]